MYIATGKADPWRKAAVLPRMIKRRSRQVA
jgi:hypothetical protein